MKDPMFQDYWQEIMKEFLNEDFKGSLVELLKDTSEDIFQEIPN